MESRTAKMAGVVLVLLGFAGMVEAIRAGWAQAIYQDTRYGAGLPMGPEETGRWCARAYRLYPHNVYFSIWTARKAFYEDADKPLTPERLALARVWCERGLRQNFHKTSLRLLMTHLLMRDDPAAALAWWKRYVDWHFWAPYNHAVLAELYAMNGDDCHALAALKWTVGSPYEAQARQAIEQAWRRDVTGP
jgi:hypothetical protein